MTSQYSQPLLIEDDFAQPLTPVSLRNGAFNEAWLQRLLFDHPAALPLSEIDAAYAGAVPICTELRTPVGRLDAIYLTRDGRLVIVETKLWRNPEARREVIGQILDYASELARWSFDDLQRQAKRQRESRSRSLFEIVKDHYADLDEARFIDGVTQSLRNGRFLLLICGDGIREDLVGITEFLDRHTSLDLTFGLVEMAVFETGSGARLVQPRVLAKTVNIDRYHLHSEPRVEGPGSLTATRTDGGEMSEFRARMLAFWKEVVGALSFDDPGAAPPNPRGQGYITMKMPIGYLVAYISSSENASGINLSLARGDLTEIAYRALLNQRAEVEEEMGQPLKWVSLPKKHIVELEADWMDIEDAGSKTEAVEWFAREINVFTNVMRPRLERIRDDV